ncbi:hypothetical protein BU26DRAFT_348506 [Trematosphaeria pertusa]|uniref:Uncharacterized protein n=1 Tax=Trematosphaeria pertusa TaxID=390896 RepID=A0A6A6ID38_9PLEO|nr:uncharacterized protein BU26DRAFT_348506 [Trematosphaeria pertusa]KAF2247470.1 hypothetical protein BU26DRAFT_348506 [Trematosphaeria pertusa]
MNSTSTPACNAYFYHKLFYICQNFLATTRWGSSRSRSFGTWDAWIHVIGIADSFSTALPVKRQWITSKFHGTTISHCCAMLRHGRIAYSFETMSRKKLRVIGYLIVARLTLLLGCIPRAESADIELSGQPSETTAAVGANNVTCLELILVARRARTRSLSLLAIRRRRTSQLHSVPSTQDSTPTNSSTIR